MKCFYDLHIHSSLSPCSSDDMTPNNIVNMSLLKELDFIAVTDHNTVKNVSAVLEVAKAHDVIVVPGMELQTKEEVHMLCFFKSLEKAVAFEEEIDKRRLKIPNNKVKFGNQLIMDKKDNLRAEYQYFLLASIDITLDEAIKLVKEYNGVIFPAHVDRKSNSIISNLGFIPEEYYFRYVEVSQRDTAKKYLSDKKFKNKYYILRNSDAHDLASINEPLYSIELEEKTIDALFKKIKKGSEMKELSLHILDIARNSITAKAENIRIAIIEDIDKDKLTIKMKDDGVGMDQDTAESVVDPFYTTRTTRDVGLGIPMFKANAESCNGSFKLNSEIGMGTEIIAEFQYSHIDRVPLGNMADTIVTIINSDSAIDLLYTHMVNDRKFTLNTKDIKKRLGEVEITNIDVLVWLRSYIKEGLEEIKNEV